MQSIKDLMSTDVITLDKGASLTDAAREMRDRDVGNVLVTKDGKLCGVLTDRDIVVRGLADGESPESLHIGEICSANLVSLSPDDSTDKAVKLMRDNAVRRMPVVQDSRPVGIVSIGDLAATMDADSALGQISAAPANS
jgi:CBS domain-containing protein